MQKSQLGVESSCSKTGRRPLGVRAVHEARSGGADGGSRKRPCSVPAAAGGTPTAPSPILDTEPSARGPANTHWSLGPSRKPSLEKLMAAGRERRSLVPEQRGQITEPAPWQCAQVPVNTSPHTDFTWLNAMEKDASCERVTMTAQACW